MTDWNGTQNSYAGQINYTGVIFIRRKFQAATLLAASASISLLAKPA
jgi:hypothetical protein